MNAGQVFSIKKRTRYNPLMWMLAIPALNVIYLLLNRPGDNVHSLVSPLDERLPFIAAFIIPYSLWYPFLMLTLIAIFRSSYLAYLRTLLALCLGLVACFAIYSVFQTTVPRPDVPAQGFLHGLVSMVYASDRPYNCFPSIHVMTSYLTIKGAVVLGGRQRAAVALAAFIIIVSTLFVKQHVMADVLAGMLLAEIMFWYTGRLLPWLRGLMITARQREVRYADPE